MHYTTLLSSFAALAALSTAAPTTSPAYNTFSTRHTIQKRDPSAQQVLDSINAWINNVDNVNTFLNEAASLLAANDGSLLAQAQMALDNASDEPTQLTILGDLSNLSSDGQGAVVALGAIFPSGVIANLNAIIGNPTDPDTVNNAVAGINDARCNVVLPNLDILWPAAADASGAPSNPPSAQREDACSQ
jgi:hypothetical protein